MKNLKLGDIVEYKVENEPYILAYCGACFYSLIQLDASGRFVALSTPRVARIQPIESSSIPVYEYKLLKEVGDFLKRVRIDVINKDDPVYSIYQDDLTSFHVSRIVDMINVSLLRVRLSPKSVQLCFNKQKFLDEVLGLLEDMYYDDDDDVNIHVYTVGNHT